ncbi:MAG: hypothetical protein QM680_09225 [Luteolibacter sp.]
MTSDEMGALYYERWRVELFLDDLKTTLSMAILKTQSPAMIHRELLFHQLAYNLMRGLILSSGAVKNSSVKGTQDRLNQWLPLLLAATSSKTHKRLVDDLIDLIGEDLVPERPFRREPRAVKRRPKPFQHMESATIRNGRNPASFQLQKALKETLINSEWRQREKSERFAHGPPAWIF